jgi:hypothetical protein
MDLEGLKTQFDAKEARISQLLRDYQELRGRFDAKDAQCKLEKENTRKARSETRQRQVIEVRKRFAQRLGNLP